MMCGVRIFMCFCVCRYDPHQVLYLNGTAESLIFDTFNMTFRGKYNPNNSISMHIGLITNYTRESAIWEVTHTGYGDPQRVGDVKSWDGSEYIDVWEPPVSHAGSKDNSFGYDSVFVYVFV